MYKVLLVDDEPIITQGLKVLFNWEDYGFEVVSIAENGKEALTYIEKNSVDLLITDIMMPKMTGLELIEHAKLVNPDMKCVVLSGYEEFDYVKQGIRLGIENYLLKPVNEDELIKTVRTIGQKLYASLADTHKPISTTLKDNTLWRLLNGDIDKGDWQERLSLYDMDVTQSFYSVSILHFENELKPMISKQVRKYIEENYAATCLYNPDQELMIIFAAKNEEMIYESNQQIADEYLDKIQPTIGTYYLAAGEAVLGMEKLEDSYSIARELTLYQVILSPNQIITSKTNIDSLYLLKKQQEVKSDLAKRMLQSKDDIVQGIQLFSESLNIGKNYISHIVIRKYTIDVISHLHHSLQIDDFYIHATSIERLIYAANIKEIMEIFQNYCDELFKEINNKSDERSPIVQDVLEYIHQNYDQELSLKTLSQRFYINSIYLGQLFQKEIGVVFSEYINHYRLEKSKELLKNTHLRAGEIGKKVGYSDTTYFYKQFKRNVGVTPTEWRNI